MSERVAELRVSIEEDEAYEFISGSVDAPVFLTCEHASERFLHPWSLDGHDARLAGTHWAFDPGAREIVHELAALLDAPAVLARFARLIIDPNRDLASPTLFRSDADGFPIHLNLGISDDDRRERIERFYLPYHRAIDAALARCSAPLVFPIHTFTDEYEGTRRHMEVGVLFDEEESLAERLRDALLDAGFVVAMNEPWSGKDGLIYSAERHARNHGRRALEIEARQDRAMRPEFRARLVPVLASFLREAADQLRAVYEPT